MALSSLSFIAIPLGVFDGRRSVSFIMLFFSGSRPFLFFLVANELKTETREKWHCCERTQLDKKSSCQQAKEKGPISISRRNNGHLRILTQKRFKISPPFLLQIKSFIIKLLVRVFCVLGKCVKLIEWLVFLNGPEKDCVSCSFFLCVSCIPVFLSRFGAVQDFKSFHSCYFYVEMLLNLLNF